MYGEMPKGVLVCNKIDELPVTGIPDGKLAMTKTGEIFIFDFPSKKWLPL